MQTTPKAASVKALATANTPPISGQYWPAQKGWYAGIQRSEDGLSGWHLILPKGAKFYFKGVTWGERGKDVAGTNNNFDGLANTIAMANAGSALALRIRELPGDCYLASRFEFALIYATLRDQIELGDWYWTSTQLSADYAWMQNFDDGSQDIYGKNHTGRARAVRRLVLQPLNALTAS